MSADHTPGRALTGAPTALCVLDLDGVRVAAASVDDAAGDDDLVALFELHHGTADLQRMVKQHVGALVHLTHDGCDAPREGELAVGALIRGQTDDVRRAAEARDQPRGAPRDGTDGDDLCADVDGHAAGGVADGIERVVDLKLRLGEALGIVDVRLGVFGDACHRAQRLDGVLAGRRLAGEHDGACAVIDGVGDVRDLGTSGADVVRHALEHLGRGDDALAEQTALADELLLDARQLLIRHLDAHVAAGDHDAGA